jgi:hypothetical protein
LSGNSITLDDFRGRKMKDLLRLWGAAAAGAMLLGAASVAHAQSVTFSDINDAVPSRFYDAAASAADPADPNRLIIRFNSGLDPSNWKSNEFKASTAAFSHTAAMDTITFRIHAPEGFYISKVTYTQRGTGSVVRTAKAAGGAAWVVDDASADLGQFGSNATLTATADLTGQNKTFVPVSITSSLFAFAPPSLGSATVAITYAEVFVELLPIAPSFDLQIP